EISLHMSAMSFATAVSGFLIPELVRKTSRGIAMRISAITFIIAIALLVAANSIFISVLACFVIGLAATGVVSLITTFLDQQHDEYSTAAISEANTFGAIGGILGPLFVGYVVSAGFGWRFGMLVAATAFIAVEVFRGSLASFNVKKKQAEGHQHGKLSSNYWWAWALLITTAGPELMIMLWSSKLLQIQGGLDDGASVAAISCLSIGYIISRTAISYLSRSMSNEFLLKIGFAIPLVAFWVFWSSPSAITMLIALGVCGLGLGMHWPVAIGRAVQAGFNNPDKASSFAAYATGGAGVVLPFALGAISQSVGLKTAFLLVPAVLLVGLLMLFIHPIEEKKLSKKI
ncbi:MAG: MFS transporter, partial [Actinobacteria bacterium]|nr:MFS transporter [Actinomycetota bacterium]